MLPKHDKSSSGQGPALREGLQALFFAGLHNERVRFVTLSAALAAAEEAPSGIFEDLLGAARRLGAAAANFGLIELADASAALEHACLAAVHTQAGHAEPAVWAALVTLVQLLGTLGESTGMPLSIELRVGDFS